LQQRLLIFLVVTLLLMMAAWSLVPVERAPQPAPDSRAPDQAVEPPPPFRRDAGRPVRIEFDAGASERRPTEADERERGRTESDERQRGRTEGEKPKRGGRRSSSDRDRVPVETVGLNEHVVVEVAVPEPGQVRLEGLGREESAAPLTPATFDLLTDEQGRYEVVYTPTGREGRPVGTLEVLAGAVG
jgi:hypothetical protein